MRTILFILQKEFLQIIRNKLILGMLFLMPVVQLIILGHAADYEIRHINLLILDQDHSTVSGDLVHHFKASKYFDLLPAANKYEEGLEQMQRGEADIILEIPLGLERELNRGESAEVHLTADAINGVKAGLGTKYASRIIYDYNVERGRAAGGQIITPIDLRYSNWYNPKMNYATFMVPGILVLLLTLVGAFLASINIVREKEMGTIEQLNVTPIKKYQFIIGKLFPFLVIGLMELTIGLVIGKLIFHIQYQGSLVIVYSFAVLYLIAVLGLGLLISTLSDTQQQAMFIAWFFLVVFILMGGLFTPIDSMPLWAQKLTLLNPIRYFIEVVRMVLLKGSNWMDVRWHFRSIFIAGLILNGLAVWNYRKTA